MVGVVLYHIVTSEHYERPDSNYVAVVEKENVKGSNRLYTNYFCTGNIYLKTFIKPRFMDPAQKASPVYGACPKSSMLGVSHGQMFEVISHMSKWLI